MEDSNTLKIEKNAIRKNWHEESGEWYFSIVDVVNLVSKSSDPRNYWKVLKNRLKKAQNKLVTDCNQLKMLANDGKYYQTDVANEETILEIVKIIAPQYLKSFKYCFEENYQKPPKRSSILADTGSASKATDDTENLTYPQVEDAEEFMLMVDAYFKDNCIMIESFVAGLNVNNVSISSTTNTLEISGEREAIKDMCEENYFEQELYWGKFARTITLPQEIDIDLAEVTEKNGMLRIKLPIVNKNRLRHLKVKSI